MDRRRYLKLTGGAIAGVGLAGCLGGGTGTGPETAEAEGADRTPDDAASASATDKPDGVYVQSFQERMSMQGTTTSGPYGFALMFTVPHTFWTVTGSEVSKVRTEESDVMHLMASVWDAETRTVVPETGLSVEVTRDGDLVSQEAIYPMLSQPMSFHYGGNFGLAGDGTYQVTVSVGAPNTRLTGGFADRLTEPAEATVDLAFTEESRDEVVSRDIDQAGQPGALRPMEMGAMPQSVAPAPDALPGTVRGSTTADDARFVVTTLSAAASPVGEPYLAVSARTRYNRYVVPAMGLAATLTRDGATVFDGRLERTLDPEVGYHYGAAVDGVEAGDELALTVTTPPQVARHEGYETAFLQFDEPTLTL